MPRPGPRGAGSSTSRKGGAEHAAPASEAKQVPHSSAVRPPPSSLQQWLVSARMSARSVLIVWYQHAARCWCAGCCRRLTSPCESGTRRPGQMGQSYQQMAASRWRCVCSRAAACTHAIAVLQSMRAAHPRT